MRRLGTLYEHGHGVRRNLYKSAELYRKAALEGETRASYLLGLCYRDGSGVRKNIRWARHWLKIAVRAREADAARALRELLIV